MKNPFCAVWILFVAVVCWYARTLGIQEKIDWSPCSSTNLTTTFRTHDGESMFHSFDDGKRVWQIKGIKPPVSDGAQPTVEMELLFERSAHNCTVWKMEHGIKE